MWQSGTVKKCPAITSRVPQLYPFTMSLKRTPEAAALDALPVRRNPFKRIIDDSDCDPVPAAAVLDGTAIVIGESTEMHTFFKPFAGCSSSKLERPPPQAAPDAALLDLRSAVPPKGIQFMDLESKHMPLDSDDTSGHTDSGSDSCQSFISDTNVDVSSRNMKFVDKYILKALPATAALLRQIASTPKRKPNPQSERDIAMSTTPVTSALTSAPANDLLQSNPSSNDDDMPELYSDSGASGSGELSSVSGESGSSDD